MPLLDHDEVKQPLSMYGTATAATAQDETLPTNGSAQPIRNVDSVEQPMNDDGKHPIDSDSKDRLNGSVTKP